LGVSLVQNPLEQIVEHRRHGEDSISIDSIHSVQFNSFIHSRIG